ncbi:magnesium and cobalt transport protein [Anopheles sinensis]|uniref:Magnesium and cobalt transport protein n=1 Tax=Anopheles sinensis TaxID=74873 RepID=A0A084VTF2_ANOSI|nr:magnesium and cobalt transport protein [Anopheles sinensis]
MLPPFESVKMLHCATTPATTSTTPSTTRIRTMPSVSDRAYVRHPASPHWQPPTIEPTEPVGLRFKRRTMIFAECRPRREEFVNSGA